MLELKVAQFFPRIVEKVATGVYFKGAIFENREP